jgi:hypothetical protein
MVEAVFTLTRRVLFSVQLLTTVTLMFVILDVKLASCASDMSVRSSRTEKGHPVNVTESQVSTVQKEEAADSVSTSTHTLSSDNSSSFAPQKHQPVSMLTAVSSQKSVPTTKHPDFRISRPNFFHTKATMSHTITRELKNSIKSDQKSIKEDVPSAETTFFTERNREAGERHSKFESGSQELSKKVLTSPIDGELSEVNNSFPSEKRSLKPNVNDSENISLTNTTAPNNATEIYGTLYTPVLYEEEDSYLNLNSFHKTLLSSNKIITNVTSNTSSSAEGNKGLIQANKSANESSNVEELLNPPRNMVNEVINSRKGANNKWGPQGQHSSNLNAGSEMSNDAITSVNTNDLDINGPSKSGIRETDRSPVLAASEVDEKLVGLSPVISTNITESETFDSLVRTEDTVRLNANTTEEIFSVVNNTQVASLGGVTVYTDVDGSDSRIQNIGSAENDASGLVNNGSDISVLNSQVETPISYGVAGIEINGSSGGIISENTREGFDEVGGEIGVISSTNKIRNMSSDLMANAIHQDSEPIENWKLRAAANSHVSDGDEAEHSEPVQKRDNGLYSRWQRRRKDSLRTLRTRDTAKSKLYNMNANDTLSGQSSSHFVKRLDSGNSDHILRQHINIPNGSDSVNSSANDSEIFLLDTNFSQIITGKTIPNFEDFPLEINRTIYVRSNNSESDNAAVISHSDKTKFYRNSSFELTEVNIQEFSALTSKQFPNRGNYVDDDNFHHSNNPSDNPLFNKSIFTNSITSTTSQSFTTNHDTYQITSISGNDITASEVTEYYNASDISYELGTVNSPSEATTEYNTEINSSNYYSIKFSTPESYDVKMWNTATTPLSNTESRLGDSNNGTETSTSDVSIVFLRNDSVSDGVPAWPVKLSAEVSGDLILGGLMMVHEREDSITCGPIMPQGGIQALETMLYTLDVLNRDPQMIPNVTIGAHILDYCDKDTYGLEMAVDFIKGRRIDCFKLSYLRIVHCYNSHTLYAEIIISMYACVFIR